MTPHRSTSTARRVLGPAAGLLAVALTSGPAPARPSSGPDVIVGDLPEVVRFTDPAAPVQAYAVGTISCNIGDDLLTWVDFNNQHPVIAQNMYRLSTLAGGVTRLEQVGQSWLKHGFIALSGSYCDFCPQGSPMGSVLGVGCADPYGAFLNGQQQSLGPRSEINPATGSFPFPISWAAFPDRTGDGVGDQPQWSGLLARRIQVARTDLTTPGAIYIVEGQYVSPDDAAAGNKHNNASYRRVTIDPATLEAVPAGLTERTRPAIYAWRDHGLGVGVSDPAVTITPIDLPGDGRFLLASRVTQTGATTWRYEYAVQNLNSNRAAYSVAVSVAGTAGATFSNPGFRDVNSHSDEIWDSTDWVRPLTGPSAWQLVWAAIQSPNANPRGNALRWGTLYNFWIDSNLAPGTGQVTLVPFSGGGSSPVVPAVRIAAPVPGGAANPLAPHNDECAQAATIGRNDFAFSTSGALGSGPSECIVSGGDWAIVGDVWFRYVHDGPSGPMTVSTCGSSYNTKIAVYAGSCPTVSGTALACNDDAAADAPAGCGAGSIASLVTVNVEPGQAYLIRVGGSPLVPFSTRTGNGLLTITPPPLPTGACCRLDGSCTLARPAACNASYLGDGTVCAPNPCPQPVPPENDFCVQAIWIADGAPATSTNVNANTDASTPPCGNGGSRDVWYKYRPAVTGDVRITTDNSAPVNGTPGGSTDFDTVLGVFAACGGMLLDCDDDSGTSPEPSSDIAAVTLEAGHTYFIRVSGYPFSDVSRQTGVFTLKVIGGGGVVPAIGACCIPDGCFVAEQTDCTTGAFAGAASVCGDTGNPIACCPANINRVGGVTVQDVFDFLAAYFNATASGDFNRDGSVSVQDVFDFLVAYFEGCA